MNRAHDAASRPGSTAALMRLRGLIRKEFLQIVRDPSSIAIAFLLPVVLLLLFGYGVSLDAEHVPIAVVVEAPSAETTSFTGELARSRYFQPTVLLSMDEADELMRRHEVQAIVRLRSNFARKRHSLGASIQVLVNGVDANNARLVMGYLEGVWQIWLAKQIQEAGEPTPAQPIQMVERVWFNSELNSRYFLVPGLIAIIMTLIGALLTAMVMAREWERGTMEAMLATPVTIAELLLGKLIPYYLLGMGGMALSVVMAVFLFEVPLRGSLAFLLGAATLFLLAALGMGLLISIGAKNQFLAGQTAIIATYLPAFILSGFLFDIRSMPMAVRLLTRIIPARYFVAILQTLFLAGDVPSVLWPNGLALLIMAAFFLGLSRLRSRKSLE